MYVYISHMYGYIRYIPQLVNFVEVFLGLDKIFPVQTTLGFHANDAADSTSRYLSISRKPSPRTPWTIDEGEN